MHRRLILISIGLLLCLRVYAAQIARGADAETLQRLSQVDRWTTTAYSGGALKQGDPTTLSWSLVPDGTEILPHKSGESSDRSNLQAFLDTTFGDRSTWFPLIESTFDRWSQLSGLSFVHESRDDGRPISSTAVTVGQVGVRGDLRLGGHAVDGPAGILAYTYLPNHGDLVFDTSDNFLQAPASANLRFRNLLAHESAHGFGLEHVFSSETGMLMNTFITTSFDGPQFDELLLVHRAYGDALEKSGGNDSYDLATPLGRIGANQMLGIGRDASAEARVVPTQTDFVSIDGRTDVDYFSITAEVAGELSIDLTPVGPTYRQGRNALNQTVLDASALNDLSVELLAAGSSKVLARGDLYGIGASESIAGFSVSELTSYTIRVTGRQDVPQLYRLDVTLSAPERQFGDVNGDGTLDVADVDLLAQKVAAGQADPEWDLNQDGLVTLQDRELLITELLELPWGDSDLSGAFGSGDFVHVFIAGQYEDQVDGNSVWQTGDWNGDLEFTSSDIVHVFQLGDYQPEHAAMVPEPTAGALLAASIAWLSVFRRRNTRPSSSF